MLRFNDSMSILPSADVPTPRYKAYNLANFRSLPQVQALGEDTIFEMEVVELTRKTKK